MIGLFVIELLFIIPDNDKMNLREDGSSVNNRNQMKQLLKLLLEVEQKKQQILEEEKCIKSLVLEKMQQNHIDVMENAKIKVNYVDGYSRRTVDGKKLQKLYPDAFQECTNISDIAPYIRVQVAK